MNPNELALWHRRHEELVREAEYGRLTRRLREELPRRPSSQPRSGRGCMAGLYEAIAL
jgi:hypothetical protein